MIIQFLELRFLSPKNATAPLIRIEDTWREN